MNSKDVHGSIQPPVPREVSVKPLMQVLHRDVGYFGLAAQGLSKPITDGCSVR